MLTKYRWSHIIFIIPLYIFLITTWNMLTQPFILIYNVTNNYTARKKNENKRYWKAQINQTTDPSSYDQLE